MTTAPALPLTPEQLIAEVPRIIGGGTRYWTQFTLEHIERLLPQYAATIDALKAKLSESERQAQEMREALKECADDLETYVRALYVNTHQYPSFQRKFDLDMEPVITARKLLADSSVGEAK